MESRTQITSIVSLARARFYVVSSLLQRVEEMLDAIDALHGRALEGLTRVFVSRHHWTLQCLSYMAAAKRERGDALSYTEAAGLYRHIFRAYEGNMGDLHPETVRVKAHVAEVMHLL